MNFTRSFCFFTQRFYSSHHIAGRGSKARLPYFSSGGPSRKMTGKGLIIQNAVYLQHALQGNKQDYDTSIFQEIREHLAGY
jgi:hypothetical protein